MKNIFFRVKIMGAAVWTALFTIGGASGWLLWRALAASNAPRMVGEL